MVRLSRTSAASSARRDVTAPLHFFLSLRTFPPHPPDGASGRPPDMPPSPFAFFQPLDYAAGSSRPRPPGLPPRPPWRSFLHPLCVCWTSCPPWPGWSALCAVSATPHMAFSISPSTASMSSMIPAILPTHHAGTAFADTTFDKKMR